MENIRAEIPIVGTIKRSNLTCNVPLDAEFASLNLSGEFIQKFYKFKTINYNDGDSLEAFQYESEGGGWDNSSYNRDGVDYPKLKDAKFLKIVD